MILLEIADRFAGFRRTGPQDGPGGETLRQNGMDMIPFLNQGLPESAH